MKQSVFFGILFALLAGKAIAHDHIAVLIARGAGVSQSAALSALAQLQSTNNGSGLTSLVYENAGDHLGYSNLTVTSSCSGNSPTQLVACAKADLAEDRDIYDADVVILVVPSISGVVCGSVLPGMINADDISDANSELAYAATALSCAWPGFVASHEMLHLLSIEHDSGDSELNKPVRDNHAHTHGSLATVGASPGDCYGGTGACSVVYNMMSDPNSTFPNTTYSLGNSTHANAKRVVRDLSWDVVAAYRPKPPPLACNGVSEFHYCAGNSAVWTITATLPGYTVTNADYDVQINGSGGWIDIYEGALTCPSVTLDHVFAIGRAILETQYGTSECTIYVPEWNCPGPGGGF